MIVSYLTKKKRIAYDIFSYLREQLQDTSLCNLRHISVYITKCYDEFDIKKDLRITFDDKRNTYKIILSDGCEISFSNSNESKPCFAVCKSDNDINMNLFVSQKNPNDLKTAYVEGTIYYNDWKFVIAIEEDQNKYSIKVYYQDELMKDATSYFFATAENDINLDCLDDLGYLTSIMMRIELLYSDIQALETSKLVRKK